MKVWVWAQLGNMYISLKEPKLKGDYAGKTYYDAGYAQLQICRKYGNKVFPAIKNKQVPQVFNLTIKEAK